ncbi:MAG: LytTR family DNA-binding domain-containing protein [Ekhidna sp.]
MKVKVHFWFDSNMTILSQFIHSGKAYKWTVTILTGTFMFLALYVYRAYHIDKVEAFTGHSMLFRAIIHSLIISSVFYLLEFHASKYITVSQRVKPFVIALTATFLGLHITFLAFNYFYDWSELRWSSYSMFLYEYPLILILPVTISYLLDRIWSSPRAQPNDLLMFTSENQKEFLKINTDHFLFIKSAFNYVEIHYQSQQQPTRYLLRKTLSGISNEYPSHKNLLRCHRSYIINPLNVDRVQCTNNKLVLSIAGESIPVSKQYEGSVTERLQ